MPADLPAVRVDAIQLQRVLVNLLDNALKFSGDSVELRAVANGDEVLLEVLDRGSGIGDAIPRRCSSRSRAGVRRDRRRRPRPRDRARLRRGERRAASTLEAREGGGTCARLTLAAEPVP